MVAHFKFGAAIGLTSDSSSAAYAAWSAIRTPAAQQACAKHWTFIAARHRGIPNRSLSFNLLNEPRTADGAAYAKVVSLLCDAIRRENPNRLIIADALSSSREPFFELLPLRVAQETRGYQPMSLTPRPGRWGRGIGRLARSRVAPAAGERAPVRTGAARARARS